MQLKLRASKVELFENSIAELAPWMHQYKFSDTILVGYYKLQGLGTGLTYCNNKSSRENIKKMLSAYNSHNHSIWPDFYSKMINKLDIKKKSEVTVLDISSATGRNSILAVNEDFGKVYSSEIRKNQCNQQVLLYKCLEDQKYNEKITVSNDVISADNKDFIALYRDKKIEVVQSFGLLYHLTNPVQHIINLREITNKYAIIYTMTHQVPNMESLWKLAIEDADWITKAVFSISWTPHFLEVPRICKMLGFKNIEIMYPEVFNKNFPVDKYSVKKLLLQRMLNKIGIKTGYYKNINFSYMKGLEVGPACYAYILEK